MFRHEMQGPNSMEDQNTIDLIYSFNFSVDANYHVKSVHLVKMLVTKIINHNQRQRKLVKVSGKYGNNHGLNRTNQDS